MSIPLYHGTRSFYKSQILRNGLTKPPTSQAHISQYLSDAFDLLSRELSFDWKDHISTYPASLLDVGEMYFLCKAAKNTSGTTMNFRYGALYLTSDLSRARTYAADPPESIRFGYKMHDVLEAHGICYLDNPFIKILAPIRKELESCEPLVLQVTTYDLDKLYDERGISTRHPVANEQASFEYRGEIPPHAIIEV